MSHFVVIVVTNDGKQETLEKALGPFHEFETTGVRDEYVVFVDKTDEVEEAWKTRRTTKFRGPDGRFYYGYEWDTFYRAPTQFEREQMGIKPGSLYVDSFFNDRGKVTGEDGIERDYRTEWSPFRQTLVREIPEGFEEVNVSMPEVYATIDEFADDYFGYKRENGKLGRWTNPNKKWDWWEVGGRWSGLLRGVGGAGLKGDPGLMGMQYSETGVDQLRKGQLDVATMTAMAVKERREAVEAAYANIRARAGGDLANEKITEMWQRYIDLFTPLHAKWREIRDEWNKNHDMGVKQAPLGNLWDWLPQQSEELKALIDAGIPQIGSFGFQNADVPESERDPLAWIEKAPPLCTFAFLDADGVWHERGRMGWFGVSFDDVPEKQWEDAYVELLARVRDDQFLTVVDCHI